MKKNDKKTPYLFLLPFLIAFIVFQAYPVTFSIFMSLFKWKSAGPEEFLGFKNYITFFVKDPFLFQGMGNVFLYLITGGIFTHLLAFFLALILNQKILRGKNIMKTAILLPYVISTVVISYLVYYFFYYYAFFMDYLINDFMKNCGLNVHQSIISILLNWRFLGWNMILYLAGIQAIPREYYEAAEIDGASSIKKHLKITCPLIIRTVFFATSITTLYCLQLFDEAFLISGGYGSVIGDGITPAYYIMFIAFGRLGRFGKGSAATWILLVVIILFILALRFTTKKLQRD